MVQPFMESSHNSLYSSKAKSGRIICCNAGSYFNNFDPYEYTGNYPLLASHMNPASWTLVDADACPKCPAGQYTDSTNLATTCQQCLRNRIALGEGLAS